MTLPSHLMAYQFDKSSQSHYAYTMTKFLLDSGDPQEYTASQQTARAHQSEIWGSTTNPSLIAKKLGSQKLTPKEAFSHQKELVLQIVAIVPGAVSAEVYADQTTTAENMAEQGREIASWHPRVVVKLPTTIEGLKARTMLRKEGITINNTLVFSQEQVFAISLHEKLMQKEYGKTKSGWPCFISPFVGRLDDKDKNGLGFVSEAMQITHTYFESDLVWMLEASVRNLYHLKAAIEIGSELVTSPKEIYDEWFGLTQAEQDEIDVHDHVSTLQNIPAWTPSKRLQEITTLDEFMEAVEKNDLNITHALTTAGIEKFVEDWKKILE